jgi:hypothetical protein
MLRPRLAAVFSKRAALWAPEGAQDTRRDQCPLEASREQVRVRRLAERAAELAAEVGAGKARGTRQVAHIEGLEVTRVREIPGAQQMARRRSESHARHYRAEYDAFRWRRWDR